MKARPIPDLGLELEEDIDKLVKEEIPKPDTEHKASTDTVKINTVDLDTVIKFEAKRNAEEKETGKNGEERGDSFRGGEPDGSGERETSLPQRSRGKSGFIY